MRKPLSPPPLSELWDEIADKLPDLLRIRPDPGGRYLHWDDLRHRQPPPGLTPRQWWLGVKLARTQAARTVPLFSDTAGEPFTYVPTDKISRHLHELDQKTSGRIRMSEEVTNPNTRDRYIINSLIEEAVTSSQLEGASTTTDVAKDMIRSGRRPGDRSEQMILNNYQAMKLVREFDRNLTPEMVFQLHRVVTDNTLDSPSRAGCFREDGDQIVVGDEFGETLHLPPPADELPDRLSALCSFANGGETADVFIHPVIRAIILHFWIGFDHPFVDGNGRTARALFYWSMLNQGYWLTEFLSISRILRNAPAQYGRSFLLTETDGNDLTYFIDYHLHVIARAVDELEKYLDRKAAQIREVEALLKESADLNYRQLALLSHGLRHPGHNYTIDSHRESHRVVYQTARTDLLDLAERDLLPKRKVGRSYVFSAPHDLGDRLRALHEQPDPSN